MINEPKSFGEILSATSELMTKGQWACINIETRSAWPTKAQTFSFEGFDLWVIPVTTDNYPGIAVRLVDGLNRDGALALLHRALSVIAWLDNSGAIVTHMTGGDLPRMMGLSKRTGQTIRDELDLSDLPQISDSRAKVALALMREGRGLNHPAYAFLSFYKVLETAIPNGRARGQWIADNLDGLRDHRAVESLSQLRASVNGDVGAHLYESGRQAIAHARHDPIINPDDPQDSKRLRAELPIMEALAVLAVEQCLGVQTSQTRWKEHLYELRGWKPIVGAELLAAILQGNCPPDINLDVPILSVRLRRSEVFPPLERMVPVRGEVTPDGLAMIYRSGDGLVDFVFHLNFREERLQFNLEDIAVREDTTARAAENAAHIARFFRDYLGNGELQLWDADTNELLSRCDAFIPTNCFLDHEAANANVAHWEALAVERTNSEA